MAKCPKKCIEVCEDSIGHIFAHATEECIDCGLCTRICPQLNPLNLVEPQKAWAVWSKDDRLRERSSSGGLATEISRSFIQSGGVVYGAAFVKPFTFQHIRCSNVEDLLKIQGSKYVQSDTRQIYNQVKNDFSKGIKVLFIGTPCQVAAIKRVFVHEDGLYTVDLICHGVPSGRLFKQSLPQRVTKWNISTIEFRRNNKFQIRLWNNQNCAWTRPLRKDLYLKGFFKAVFYRNSCFSCKYATSKRVGDITLGDFWGIDESTISTSVEKGISLGMENTEKGSSLLQLVSSKVQMELRPTEEAVNGNGQLRYSTRKSFRVFLFRFLYPKLGFKKAAVISMLDIVLKNMIVRK